MAITKKPREDDATALTLWAGAGHDLRQPIQSLLLMVHILSLTEDAEKRKQTARSMEHALQMLEGMIGELARVARLETGAVPVAVADVALDPFLQRIAGQNRKLAHAYALTISVEASSVIARIDERRCGEIVGALLRNAIALAKGGDVSITASMRRRDVRIDIAFDGPVLTPQQANSTFVELASVETGAVPTPGLKMLKVMARQMHGSINVASRTDARQVLSLSFGDAAPLSP